MSYEVPAQFQNPAKEVLMHVCILDITTIGLPHASTAMTWIKDLFEKA